MKDFKARWWLGFAGWMFGGPILAIVGFLLGSLADNQGGARGAALQAGDSVRERLLMRLVAAVLSAEAGPRPAQLVFLKDQFERAFGPEKAQALLLLLREALEAPPQARQAAAEAAPFFSPEEKRNLFRLLFGLVSASGSPGARPTAALRGIGSMWEHALASDPFYQRFKGQDERSLFQVLGLTEQATDEEVKRSYRQLALTYHPDRVMDREPEYQREAAERFKQINQAYEKIKLARGLK